MERHDVWCACAEWRLDRCQTRRPYDMRRYLCGLCAEARLAEARCGHFFMAESARRRRRAWDAHSLAARGGATRKLQTSLAAPEDLPFDQRRQAQRRNLRRGNDQYAIDAVR